MFDIGFSEMLVIAVVALIVIGPERLPRAARTLGHLFGRMQRYVNDVKSDINREMELEELRKLQATMQNTVNSIEQSVNSEISAAEAALKSEAVSATESVSAVNSALHSANESVPSSHQLELGLDGAEKTVGKS